MNAAAFAPAGGNPPGGRGWRDAVELGIGYVVLAIASIALAREPGSVATLWYANALGSAALMWRPPREWPLPVAMLALAVLAANLAFGDGLLRSLAFVPANLLEMLLAAAALRRAGLASSTLRSPRAMLALLLLGALLAPLAGALAGAATLAALLQAPFQIVLLQWFEGAAIGALSTLPLAALALRPGAPPLSAAIRHWQVAALAPAAVAVTLLSLHFLPFPFVTLSLPLLLAAMTLPFVATALLTWGVSVTVTAAMALGVFVPPPAINVVQESLVFLAQAGALVPPLLLAAAVAALRDSHARLLAREAELQRANEGLEQFVHLVAHDLREPLNTIAQFGALIEQDHGALLPPDGRQFLGRVNAGAARLRSLLDEVLQFARVRGARTVAAETVPLDRVLQEVRHALAARLAASGGRLEVAPLPVVRGQAGLLSMLFQNLVSNALKFVPPGRVPEVQVEARIEGGDAWVTVADNGIGIAAADLERLFAPFQRLNLRRDYDGHGLGLALSRQIAEAHGGRIEVESEPGRGSRFSVRLPLAAAGSPAEDLPNEHAERRTVEP